MAATGIGVTRLASPRGSHLAGATGRPVWRQAIPIVVAVVAVIALVIGIAVASGFTAAHVRTNDGAVWVTSADREALGRANTRIQLLSSVVESDTDLINVVQDESSVYLLDEAKHTLIHVDERTNTLGQAVALPAGVTDVVLAAGTLVAHARETGDVWVVSRSAVGSFDARAPAQFTVGPNSVIAVDPAGKLVGASLKDSTVTTGDITSANKPTTIRLDATLSTEQVSVASVAGAYAVLDAPAGTLYLPGHAVNLAKSNIGLPGNGVIGASTADESDVLVATSAGLARVSLGGQVTALISQAGLGRPAAPYVQDGCVYAAWSASRVWTQCPGRPANDVGVDGMASSAALVIRERAGTLALNDTQTGMSWTLQDGVHLIDNWDDLMTRDTTQQTVVSVDNGNETIDPTPQPPVARDDDFGARPGRVSFLPVLLNDYDPNGDVIVVDSVTPIPAGMGEVEVAPDRTSVRVHLDAGATGVTTFGYTIDDGRGSQASARVTLTVRGDNENSPPVQVRQTLAEVGSGGQTTLSILGDWYDPDGDPIHVANATAGDAGVVTFSPSGRLSYVDSGSTSGNVRVDVEVSDGRDSGFGAVVFTIKPAAAVDIRAEAYSVLTYPDEPTVINPADRVRGGTSALSLTGVPAVKGLDIVPNFDNFEFTVTAGKVGTYYVSYAVTDGHANGSGIVRVDVVPRPAAGTAPVTAPHQIVVGVQETRAVDVTASDRDPAGGVLVVTGLTAGANTPDLRAEIIDHHVIRVTLLRPLPTPAVVTYRISNGLAEAEGQVTVVEATPTTTALPPIAMPDAATVRAGNVVDIPVLANDVHPTGGALSLAPQLDKQVPDGAGLLFVSGNQLRYLAPSTPGTYSAVYRVVADNGQWASGTVSITVRPEDPASNRAPQPPTVVARAVAGSSVRIPIPLIGIDPEGDSVQFAGLASNPTQGVVTDVGSDWIEYEAGPYSSQTDTFTYSVIDRLGASAVGVIRVGIASESTGLTNPVAGADNVVVRPGHTIVVNPLVNDSDPARRPLTVTKVEPTDKVVTASVANNLVTISVPDKEGTYAVLYEISNDLAGTASNFITVTVRADAPLNPPLVPDTVVSLTDILNRTEVEVNPLANAFWSDGSVSDLRPTIVPGFPGDARVTGQTVRVTIGKTTQIIPIRVVHPEDPSVVAYAFIWVPGTDDARPQLKRGTAPIEVVSEKSVRININDYVTAAGGRSVRLTSRDTVRATHANDDSLVIDDQTLQFTSARTYFGPASISFEVTDAADANDPAGRRSVIVLPLTVLPRENQPPSIQDTGVDLEPGGNKVIDLVKITKYPYAKNIDELTYRASSGDKGVTATLNGTQLTVSAQTQAVKGTLVPIEVTPSDAVNHGEQGVILVRVVPSTRPLAVAQPDRISVRRGQAISVDVLANDAATNPFPDKPLRVIAVRGNETADLPPGVTVVPSPDKSTLNVVVAPTAAPGDVTLQYEIADATDDPDRYVWGVVTISIQDVPDAPTKPVRAAGFVSGQLTLSWAAPASNNAPITHYVVTSNAGYSQQCDATVCTLTGLPSGARFQFSVVAVNDLGSSAPSPQSDPLSADQTPPAPGAVTAVTTAFDSAHPAGGGIDAAWTAVTSPAGSSPVSGYLVQILQAGQVVYETRTDAATTSIPTYWGVAGLGYVVRVAAVNDADTTDWNWQSSATVVAAGPPTWVSGPTVDATGVHVAWAAANRTGAPDVTTYYVWRSTDELTASCPANPQSGALAQTTDVSWDDAAPPSDGDYWYAVYAVTSYGCVGGSTFVTIVSAPGQASYGSASLSAVSADSTRISVVAPTTDRAVALVFNWQILVAGSWVTLNPNYATTDTFEVDVSTALLANPFTVTIRGCTVDDVCGAPGGSTSIPVPPFGG